MASLPRERSGDTMAHKSLAERIAELEQKQQQLEAQKAALEAQAKQESRKQRTRTLIQVGGVLATMGVTTVEEAGQLQAYAQAHESWWTAWRSTT